MPLSAPRSEELRRNREDSPLVLVSDATFHGSSELLRDLAGIGLRTMGIDRLRLPPLLRPRWMRRYRRLPSTSRSEFEQSLLACIEEVQPDLFFPVGRITFSTVLRHRDRLERSTLCILPPPDSLAVALDKVLAGRVLQSMAIPTPAHLSIDEAREHLRRTTPGMLVIKPARVSGGALGVTYADSPATFDRALASIEESGDEVHIQEYIPGDPNDVVTTTLLFGRDSRLLSTFSVAKIRQSPGSGGSTVIGTSIADPGLVDIIRPFFEGLRWWGPAEVEWKRDSRDGQYRVIEINPRFPAYLRFPMQCGLPFGALAASDALGKNVADPPAADYRLGERYLDPVLLLRSIREEASLRGWAKALRAAKVDLRGCGRSFRRLIADAGPMVARILSHRAPDPVGLLAGATPQGPTPPLNGAQWEDYREDGAGDSSITSN